MVNKSLDDPESAGETCFNITSSIVLSRVPYIKPKFKVALPAVSEGEMIVYRWGKRGPLLEGDWVMRDANLYNYILSGKWQPLGSNKFASFSNIEYFVVKVDEVVWPLGSESYKGFILQRMYLS